MKVLLVCLILTVGCHSNEETNITSTKTLTSTTAFTPTSEFESLKIPSQTNTTPSYQSTTSTPVEPKNVTTELPISFIKKKPFGRVQKLKNANRNQNFSRVSKEKVEYPDLKREETKSIEKKPKQDSVQIIPNSQGAFVDPIRNYSVKYKGDHNSKKNDLRNRIPDQNIHRTGYNPYGRRNRYSHEKAKNYSGDRNQEESRRNENFVRYSYKLQTLPQNYHLDEENEIEPRIRGRPTLPEIQNVIHTLDSQDNTPSYNSPKENHIVEVTEVPLVFEHHYKGDYKNPQSNFVAHQYSYSPPADPTNEAYRLGKLLSQNVVQKLQAEEEPLKEYIQDQQELILSGYTHGIPTYSLVNVNLNPSQVNAHHHHHQQQQQQLTHPLMKYLAPEVTPQSFSHEIKGFQPHPYQFVRPQTHMQPIVVPDDEPGSGYGTTYLQAINQHHHTQNQGTRTENQVSTYQDANHEEQTHENSVPRSPYTVSIQQQHINVPKYTIANFKHNIKPQAIHEVEPPNLAEHSGTFNLNTIQYQMPAVHSTHSEIIGNPLFNSLRAEDAQKDHQEQQIEHPGLEFGPPSTKLIHFVLPQDSSSTPTMVHQPRPQMISSRPYWRRPQSMKLVRVPQNQYQQPEEQNYQTQYQSYRIPTKFEENPRTRNQQLYQSLAEHYSTPVRMQQSLRNLKQHNSEFQSNIMSLVSHQNQGQRSHFNGRPIVVEDIYQGQHDEEDAQEESGYTHETRQNQISEQDDNSNINQENVQIIKSVSKYYPQLQEHSQREPSQFGNSELNNGDSSVLPKGYMSFQPHRVQRVPSTRHVMPLLRYRNREIYDPSMKIPNPRIRRLVNDLLKDNNRRRLYVVMTEEE